MAGGASAAARARRLSEDAEIIVLERGPHVSFANCGLPYFVGGEIEEEEKDEARRTREAELKIELDRKVGEAIDIYVNNRLVARGEVVLVEDKLGVTMTEIIKAEKN